MLKKSRECIFLYNVNKHFVIINVYIDSKNLGEDVPGSPFTVRVSGAPDASKVRVYGPGIEHGVLAIFQSRFICDTRGAGAGQLTVRVRGPKGKSLNSLLFYITFLNL